MLLRKLRLQNFRQFKEIEVEFSPGLIAIVGANGSGKTTLLESISWALYGEQRKNKDTLRHMWADGKDKVSVTLEFSLGARIFFIERTFDKAVLSELTSGGEIILASGLASVSNESVRLLHLTYEQFTNSFCAEQKQLEFLKFDAERKQEQIAKMLGFDNLREAAKLCKERSKEARLRVEGMKDVLSSGKDCEQELKQRREEAAGVAKVLADAEEVLKKKQSELSQLEPKKDKAEEANALRARMQERKAVAKALKENIAALEKAIGNLKEKLAEKKSLEKDAAKYEALEKTQKELLQEKEKASERKTKEALYQRAQADLAVLLKELESLQVVDLKKIEKESASSISSCEDAQAALNSAKEAWAKSKSDVQQKVALALQRVETIQKELDKAQASERDGKCATCGQPLPDGHLPQTLVLGKELEASKKSLEQARKEASTFEKAPKELANTEQQLQKTDIAKAMAEKNWHEARIQDERRSQLEKSAKQQEAELSKLKSALANLPDKFDESKIDSVEKELKELQPRWKAHLALSYIEERIASENAELVKAKGDFELERTEYKKYEDRLAELGMSEEEAQRTLLDCAAMGKLVGDLRVQTGEVKAKYAQLVKGAEEAKARYEEYKKHKKEAEEVEKEYRLQSEVAKGLTELRDKLNSITRPQLEQFASAALANLTGGRYLELKLSDKFEPTLYEDGNPKKVISGGEEDIVALALRLALTQMIQERSGQPMSLLILDEVFGSLDPERRQSVLEKLEGLRGMFEQILVISHIEAINEAADRCLMVRYDPETRASYIDSASPDLALAGV